jgi:hypothetical protein
MTCKRPQDPNQPDRYTRIMRYLNHQDGGHAFARKLYKLGESSMHESKVVWWIKSKKM